ncbi:MAG TPA: alkaline phosphatase family protein [Solirubrobacteraceae bacterium]|nr:alkaline phosphatase family protein [Solirubrobacteraceae bacterium]
MTPTKLVLAVIDGMKPSALERAVATGRAPTLGLLMERGTYVDDCCAAFPSVTPVCAAAIATGTLQDRHRIPSMNWWSREEKRYVEYGSSFGAARRLGINRQLVDTVYNMNMEHLAEETPTVFEELDDAGHRTAGTTYLMYRGRHEHMFSKDTALTRIAGQTLFRRPILGPRELFYADVYASRATGCKSQLGMPGLRDQHSGCVSAYMVEHDLFDFLLLSLPDNDTHSHKNGPHAQVTSIHDADRQLERVMRAGGGTEAFLESHAVIVVADHSHAAVEQRVDIIDAFGDLAVAGPGRAKPDDAEIAVCPAQRSAMVYVLVPDARDHVLPQVLGTALDLDGVDLAMHREQGVAIVTSRRGALSFAPGEEVRDARGTEWIVRGNLEVLDARIEDGVFCSDAYPDALARVWAALECPTSGDVLLSASPGYEFADWGGADHVGGGSHGSLHRSDSLGALVFAGIEPEHTPSQWSIRDVAGMVRRHFRLPSPA